MPSTLDKPLVRSDQELATYVQNAPADVMTIPGSDSTLEAQIERIIGQRHPDRLVFAPIHELAKELGSKQPDTAPAPKGERHKLPKD